MDSVNEFKQFVRNKPELSTMVLNGTYQWQQLYEMYMMYGEHHEVWQQIQKPKSNPSFDWMGLLKNIDMDTLLSGMQSLEKLLGLFAGYLENNQSNFFED